MITLPELIKEKKELLATDPKDHKPSQLNRIKKRIQFVNQIVAYLEGKPDVEYLKKEVKRIEDRIKKISDEFSAWIPDKKYDDRKRAFTGYSKLCGVPDLKLQLKTLRFLINS